MLIAISMCFFMMMKKMMFMIMMMASLNTSQVLKWGKGGDLMIVVVH